MRARRGRAILERVARTGIGARSHLDREESIVREQRSPRWRRLAAGLVLVGLAAVLIAPQVAPGAKSPPAGKRKAAVAKKAKPGTPVAIPNVTGPIPENAQSHVFTVGGVDLAAHDYVLEEFFVSGKANVYDWGANGTAQTPQVRTPNAPYTTRIVVRRPAKRSDFSGTVWVEMNNPSRGYDVEVQWPAIHRKILRDGDIHVALTAKPISIAALKRFDAQRYAPLSMANPLPPAQQACGLLPGEPGYNENTSKLFENGLIWDIHTQTGALLKSKSDENPLRGWKIRHVFATAESQTGFFLDTYAADFHELVSLPGGKPVFDGVVSVSAAGRSTPLNQCITATGPDDPRSHLPAKHVPFMRIDSQSEPFTLGGLAWRRADSDDPQGGYRLYEIAGASHGWSDIANYQSPEPDIAKAGGVPLVFSSVESKWNSLPRQYIEPAMYANMELWVKRGIAPPRAEPLQVSGNSFVLDRFGNALGGVRNSYVDVPIATYRDYATAKPGGGFCGVFGHEVAFASEQVQSLYGAVGPHQSYVAKVKENVQQMLQGRWLLPEDAERIVLEAELARLP
jgi:hypothetical protein